MLLSGSLFSLASPSSSQEPHWQRAWDRAFDYLLYNAYTSFKEEVKSVALENGIDWNQNFKSKCIEGLRYEDMEGELDYPLPATSVAGNLERIWSM